MEDIIPILAQRGVFTLGRTIPAILTQQVLQGQTVAFDAYEGVFVNVPALGTGSNGNGLINLQNTGSGVPLSTVAGNLLSIKSLVAGANITLVDNGQTVTINSSAIPTSGYVSVYNTILDYTSGTTDLLTLPEGSIILSTEIAVMTAFNGTPTLTLGTAVDPNLLVEDSDIDLTSVMSYKDDVSFVMPGTGDQIIQSFFTANGATQGQFSVFVEYFIE